MEVIEKISLPETYDHTDEADDGLFRVASNALFYFIINMQFCKLINVPMKSEKMNSPEKYKQFLNLNNFRLTTFITVI